MSETSKCTNRYQAIINDEESDFDKEFENNINIQVVQTKQKLNFILIISDPPIY